MDTQEYAQQVVRHARKASKSIAKARADAKNDLLEQMAQNLLNGRDELREANEKDLAAGREAGLSDALLDRLELTDDRIEKMAAGLRTVAKLKDPVGHVVDGWTLPNGLELTKKRVPLGVVCMIYEARPNVTADAAALCLKSGNAVILRGGKEALHSNMAIHSRLAEALEESAIDSNAIQVIRTTDRSVVDVLLKADEYVDVVIPRGGPGLIRKVAETASVPVIKHYEGICHTYVDKDADLDMAVSICENAKCQRPGVCNAMETMLVHRDIAETFFGRMMPVFKEHGVEIRGCPATRDLVPDATEVTEEDWRTEYLADILSVRVVDSVGGAVDHINEYGSSHSDGIVTEHLPNAQKFLDEVDSATVYVNASTRFTDGGEFGLGAEIGISTDKLHARGPMALEELTTYKWTIMGTGQIRT